MTLVEFYPLEKKVIWYFLRWCGPIYDFYLVVDVFSLLVLEGTLRNASSSGPDCRSTLPSGGSVAALSYFSSSSILLYSFQTVRHAHLFWQLPKKVVNFFQWIPNDDAVLTAIFVWTIPRLDVCLLVTREEEKYVVWRHHQNGFGNSLLLF